MKLLEHFKALSIYPENAKELKGLILQLAIQGKLTAQWREENKSATAKELLEKIQAEKAQLIKEKKIKKEKALPPIGKDEIPFELPESWEWCRLGDLGVIASSSRVHKKDWKTEGIPFYRAREIVKLSKFDNVDNDLFISEDLYKQHEEKGIIPEFNDIMLTGVGTIGIPYIVKKRDKFYFKDASVLIFKNIFRLYTDYLNLFFHSNYWFDEIHRESMGTTVHTLTISRAKMIPTIFPPLAEQKAIVQIVDTLFKEVEALEELTQKRVQLKEDFITSALRKLSEGEVEKEWAFLQEYFSTFMTEESNVKKLRECILQLAVQGKLTRAFREEHPELAKGEHSAKALLEKIQLEKAQLIKEKKIKKEKALPAISQEEIPYELPEGWEWCRMQDLCQLITDGTHQTPKYTDSGRMFLSAKNVKPFQFMPKEHRFVSEEDFEGYRKNRKPEYRDILLTRVGAGIGEAALIDQDLEFAIYVSVALLKTFSEFYAPEYLLLWINSPEGRKHSAKNTYGKGVSQGNLNLSLIRGFVVSFPSLSEQQAIVTKVNQLMTLCDSLEQEIAQNKAAAQQLMQSVLREVFQADAKES